MSFSHKIVPNFLSHEECELILDFSLESLKLKPAETVSSYLNDTSRKSNVAFYPYYKTFPFLYEKLNKVLTNEINVKGFDLDYLNSEFQFTEYKIGDYFNWHIDVSGDIITRKDRYCSMVIQLNNEYIGGNLDLKLTDGVPLITIEKGVGDLVIFLSDIEHRVTNITKGNRYTLVNWIGLKDKINFIKTLL